MSSQSPKKVGRPPKNGVAMTGAQRQAVRMARLKAVAGLDQKDLQFALTAGADWSAYELLSLVAAAEHTGRWNPLDRHVAEESAGRLLRFSAARYITAKDAIIQASNTWPEFAAAVPGALKLINKVPVA